MEVVHIPMDLLFWFLFVLYGCDDLFFGCSFSFEDGVALLGGVVGASRSGV